MSHDEFAAKHARVAEWLASAGADAVLVCAPANVAWLGCGGELLRLSSRPAFALTADRAVLLCASEDADRLRQEEVRGLPVEVTPVLSLAPEALADRARAVLAQADRWRSDAPLPGVERDASFDGLRRSLHPDEIERLMRLGRDAAATVEDVAAECHRGIAERDAAARLAAECMRRNLAVCEILAGADERFESYARPLPKSGTAERTLVLGLVASRGGLHVALSRTLCVSPPDEPFLQRFTNGVELAARLRHFARSGESLGTVVQRAVPQPMLHLGMLGGTLGYAYYEHEARVSSSWKLGPQQALAWSVVAPGLRVEDTDVSGPHGFQLATATENWPRRAVRVDGTAYELPDLLLL